jgi:malate dehydrogenase
MFNVAILGAAGGIGQPLSLLSKLNPYVNNLNLFDIVNTPGVAADLSHICTQPKVQGFAGMENIGEALSGSDIVLIPAGVPRKPGMTRDDLFNTNATIVLQLAEKCAEFCPNAHFLVISNPVNSTVPIFSEVLKRNGVYDPKKLFGVTTLDVVRARTFVADKLNLNVDEVRVDVVGGHAGTTIVPLLEPFADELSEEDLAALKHRIQFGGDEVVQAKDGAGSATLSMALAANIFSTQLMRALAGETGVRECCFVESEATRLPFFSSPVSLGQNGVEEIHGVDSEHPDVAAMIETLEGQINKGLTFAQEYYANK